MSENILIDGKPLHLLRVVDLREELKKRNVKVSGTKVQLQELLIKAIQHEQELAKESAPVGESNVDKDSTTSNEENSNGSTDNNSVDNSETEPKVASISINEETETIKLTIRSSPRKSEPPPPALGGKHESETESSSQSEAESTGSPKVQNESIDDGKPDSSINDGVDIANDRNLISRQTPIATESNRTKALVEKNHVVPRQDSPCKDNQIGVQEEKKSQISVVSTTEPIDKSPVNIEEQEKELKPINQADNNDKSKKLDDSLSVLNAAKPAQTKKTSPRKRATPESAAIDPSPSRRRLLSHTKSTTEEAKKENDSHQHKGKTSIRGRLLSHSKSINEEDPSKPLQKKRRWGSSQTGESTLQKKGISSDELKQLISEAAVTESDSSVSKVSKVAAVANAVIPTVKGEEVTVQQTTNLLTNVELEPKEEIKKVDVEFKPSADSSAKKITLSVQKENQAEEAEPGVSKIVTPAKNVESTVLFVSGLVRPYTLPQLKKLLSANGSIDEEKFWIDKIKSKCYVVYSTTEEAIKTRETLHSLKWPQSSPKNLSVEFATLEDIDRCLHPENYEDLPPLPQTPLKTSQPAKQAPQQQPQHPVSDKPKKEAAIEISKGKYDIILNEPIRDDKAHAKNSFKDDASSRNVREWDRNKVNLSSRKENNEEQDNRKRGRHSLERDPPAPEKKEKTRERSKTPEKITKKSESAALRETNKKSESPAKMLEDLFRKTKSQPYIYWLPLTDEQVIEKKKQREIFENERQARIAARRESNNKREISSPNRSAHMHPNFPPRDRPKLQDTRRRSPSPPRRKRSISPSPRKNARYSRSRSPDRRRISPRRRR